MIQHAQVVSDLVIPIYILYRYRYWTDLYKCQNKLTLNYWLNGITVLWI